MEKADLHTGLDPVSEVFFAMCKSVDTPAALSYWLKFKYNQLDFARTEFNTQHIRTASQFQDEYLLHSFLTKYKGLTTGLDLREEALKKFATSESLCKDTNRLLKLRDPIRDSIFHAAQRKIARVLGDLDSFKREMRLSWGPGATDDISRREAFVDAKLSKLPLTCTRRLLPFAREELASDRNWSGVILNVLPDDILGPFCFTQNVFKIVEGSVLDTVDKNATTHRIIMKEPRLNGFFQKGAGSWIRKRLKRVGVDLNDQWFNQNAACRALRDNLATIDLKAASDTIAKELVFELLPVDWAIWLDNLRSHSYTINGDTWFRLEKFSSMGNGFTFELESLIFWAITQSTKDYHYPTGEDVLVYGDDIICPQQCSSEIIDILQRCGFVTNVTKTFTSGKFYESCGRHYYEGYDVTPIYQKEVIDSAFEHLRMANRILRCASRFGGYAYLYGKLKSPWLAALRGSQNDVTCIPLGNEGDDGWLLPAEYWPRRHYDANLGFKCRVYAVKQRKLPAHESALLAWTLRKHSVANDVDLREKIKQRRLDGLMTLPWQMIATDISPYLGDVTEAEPTKVSSSQLTLAHRWVMPNGEFGLEFSK